MNINFDYTNDPRWEPCSEIHKKFGITPNWFINVLVTNIDKTRLERYKLAIETGTFEGYTTQFFAELFDKVYTSEKYLENNSYTSINLKERYSSLYEKYKNIDFCIGDSPAFLAKILPHVNQPCVILLDAHVFNYSPIKEELIAIKEHLKVKDVIILIDDCDDIGTCNWPNKDEFERLILDINPNFNLVYTHLGRNILLAYE